MLKWVFGIHFLYTVTKAYVLGVRNNTGHWVQSHKNYIYCVHCEARGWCELPFLLVIEKQVFGVRCTELVNLYTYISLKNISLFRKHLILIFFFFLFTVLLGKSSSSPRSMKDLLRLGAHCCSPRWKVVHRDPVRVHSHTHLGLRHSRRHHSTCSAEGLYHGTAHLLLSSAFFLEGSYSLDLCPIVLISVDQRLVPVVYLSQWNKYISILVCCSFHCHFSCTAT